MPLPPKHPSKKEEPSSGWESWEPVSDGQIAVPTLDQPMEDLPVQGLSTEEERIQRKKELAMHPLELVPGYDEPDYRGIPDTPIQTHDATAETVRYPEGAFDEEPKTLRSAQLESNPETDRKSGVRRTTPEVKIDIKKKTG